MPSEPQTIHHSESADRLLRSPDSGSPVSRCNPLDLEAILAGFNDNIQRESGAISVEQRNFGQSIELFNFRKEVNGSICKPIVKKPRKARVAKETSASTEVKERKPRAPRVKLVKEPKVKAPRKVPVTITGRSILAYAAQTPNKTSGPQVDQSITRYLTPTNAASRCTLTTQSSLRFATQKKNKTGCLSRVCSALLSPKSARRAFDAQKLLYRKGDCKPRFEPLPLGPSNLICLSRGLWQAGNRDLNGGLTDGGPREITSNQEAQDLHYSAPLVNLTMLPVRRHIDSELFEDSSETRKSFDFIDQMSHCGSESSIDYHDIALGTQEYLNQLVAESDDCSASCNMPKIDLTNDPVPALHSMHSLRESLISTLESDSENRKNETTGKRVFDDNGDSPRNVASKAHRESSPHDIQPKTIDVNSFKNLVTSGPEARLAHDTTMCSQKMPRLCAIDHAGIVIEIDTSDEDSPRPSGSQITYEMVIKNQPSDVTMPTQNQKSFLCSPHTDYVELDDQLGISSVRKSNSKIESKARLSPQYGPGLFRKPVVVDEDDYWVVPDSEDEAPENPSKTARVAASSNGLHQIPNFRGYTTARLQSELSTFGFKVGKNRDGMIGLLNKCWEAKRSAGPQVSQLRSASTSSAPVAASTFVPKISDAQDGVTEYAAKQVSKKPRETAAEKATRLAEEKKIKENKKALAAQERAAKKLAEAEAKKSKKLADKVASDVAKFQNVRLLYDNLNVLLRSQEGLPWWQRMLKYEPIVLEDFRDWLLDKKSIEAEVDTIRDYFDSKGVCCVKKMTRTGKDRKRF